MSKAGEHAKSSAVKFGGIPDDYIKIHEKIDSSKIAHGEVSHRVMFHSTFCSISSLTCIVKRIRLTPDS